MELRWSLVTSPVACGGVVDFNKIFVDILDILLYT
jgi:hypothetical protein